MSKMQHGSGSSNGGNSGNGSSSGSGRHMMTGTIFDIQRFALHDGPGIRTTVFFKGCSNRCGWCHNPESFASGAQLQFFPKRCAGCMRCAKVCPNGAHYETVAGHVLDRSKCTLCGACAAACYEDALVMTGRRVTVDEVMREVMEDAPYYKTSGGGVTLSGGEPVLQSGFALELLKALKAQGIHTNIQTAGNYDFELLAPLIPYFDMVMYDIKGISEEIYGRHIRGDRKLMLDNLFRLDEALTERDRLAVLDGAAAQGGPYKLTERDALTALDGAAAQGGLDRHATQNMPSRPVMQGGPDTLMEQDGSSAQNGSARLAARGGPVTPLIVRTPVVVGVNASECEIEAIARYIKPLAHLESYRLIPYHGLGGIKYDALGEPYENDYASPSTEEITKLEQSASKHVPVFNYIKDYTVSEG